jgi:hypothetical protein
VNKFSRFRISSSITTSNCGISDVKCWKRIRIKRLKKETGAAILQCVIVLFIEQINAIAYNCHTAAKKKKWAYSPTSGFWSNCLQYQSFVISGYRDRKIINTKSVLMLELWLLIEAPYSCSLMRVSYEWGFRRNLLPPSSWSWIDT